MGAVPSRESHEGPNTVYFSNNTGLVAFRLPLTPHYFPSADCLAFKEVHRVRDSQSSKYGFNIKEAFAVLPDAAASAFEEAQKMYWGPEVKAEDPSLYYQDAVIAQRTRENALEDSINSANPLGERDAGENCHNKIKKKDSKHQSAPKVNSTGEERALLYRQLVVAPTEDALIDTDAEMCALFAQEQDWRAARDVVRLHRAFVRQSTMSANALETLDDAERVIVDVEQSALRAAEAVPPPAKWLRPLPEVIVERMSMEDAAAAHAFYREHHAPHDAAYAAATDAASKSSAPPCPSDPVTLCVLDEQGRQPLVESDALDEEMLRSYPGFQEEGLPFQSDPQYMDGRVHLVAHEGVNYLFAYNPAYVRAMGCTVAVDGAAVDAKHKASAAAHSENGRAPFVTTHVLATRLPEDCEDPNQRRAYEMFQPVFARYYIPIMPVRIIGVDSVIPCPASCEGGSGRKTGLGARDVRGPAWMRGHDLDPEEEAYEVDTLFARYGVRPPPVLRLCRFIHAAMGDKIMNRLSVLGCMTFRERCVDAGLPDAIACPLWGLLTQSDIPQLQFQREMELRLLAAMHEIDDGDMRIRRALSRQHRWNNYVAFTNSPMHGFMICAPPERRFRADADGKLRVIGEEEGVSRSSSRSSSRSNSSERGGKEQTASAKKAPPQKRPVSKTSTNSSTTPTSEQATPKDTVGFRTPMKEKEDPAIALSVAGQTRARSSDSERADLPSGSTSARSAAHQTPSLRVKRTRDGECCLAGCEAPQTDAEKAALKEALAMGDAPHSCTVDAKLSSTSEDSLDCLADPPAALPCAWSFKRRRLGSEVGEEEDMYLNPNFSVEDWMPMVTPLTKDEALAHLGVRVTVRGRSALVQYSGSAVQKLFYYLSQASAPIFCLPYVGAPQSCPNVFFEGVLRAPSSASDMRREKQESVQIGLQPPSRDQVRHALAAYAVGKVPCYVFADLHCHSGNAPTSYARNHYKDDVLLREAMNAGITSPLILAQIPLKADARRAVTWYHESLAYGSAILDESEEADAQGEGKSVPVNGTGQPYAEWPALLDAPAPCDGDVLVVCPRTHRWIRVTTLMLVASLLAIHAKNRTGACEVVQPVPILDYYANEHFAGETKVLYDALVVKNVDSEGMQCCLLNIRGFFSYNGIVELLLDRLRTIVEAEAFENKDDLGWLLHRAPSTPTSPTTIEDNAMSVVSLSSPSTHATPSLPPVSVLQSHRYVECGSFFIWSFTMADQRYFFGTKPRFIRLAMQRQKQNQRRRQKRKTKASPAPTSTAATQGQPMSPSKSEGAMMAASSTMSGSISSSSGSSVVVSQRHSHAGTTEVSGTSFTATAADDVQAAPRGKSNPRLTHPAVAAAASIAPPPRAETRTPYGAVQVVTHHRLPSSSGGGGLHDRVGDSRLCADERVEMEHYKHCHQQWVAVNKQVATAEASLPLAQSASLSAWCTSIPRRRFLVPMPALPRGSGSRLEEMEGGRGGESSRAEEVGVQVAKSSSLVDARAQTFRWNPYGGNTA